MDPLAAVSAVAAARAVAALARGASPRNAPDPAALSPGSDRTELSPGAQLVEALLNQDPQGGPAASASPLLPAAPPAGPQGLLALAMERAVRQSGLFYESHLADWVKGELPLADLLKEPQAGLPALPAPPAENSAWPQQVDARAGSLVRQQLLTLDTQVVPWHGEVWPGQAAQWTVMPAIDPEARHEPPGAAPTPQGWTSQLRLKLPGLGAVDVELRWTGARCSVRVTAPAHSLPGLRTALPMLAHALADAGVPAERIRLTALRDARDD